MEHLRMKTNFNDFLKFIIIYQIEGKRITQHSEKKTSIQSAIKFHIKLVRDIDHIFTVLQTKHSLIT